ncbi:pyridine nucleotide-disulfide oxidoreductase, partial [Acinetobacter baumannii]
IEPNQTVAVNDGRSIKINNLWLVGYGEWTGMASATLIGVSRTDKAVVDEIAVYLAID